MRVDTTLRLLLLLLLLLSPAARASQDRHLSELVRRGDTLKGWLDADGETWGGPRDAPGEDHEDAEEETDGGITATHLETCAEAWRASDAQQHVSPTEQMDRELVRVKGWLEWIGWYETPIRVIPVRAMAKISQSHATLRLGSRMGFQREAEVSLSTAAGLWISEHAPNTPMCLYECRGEYYWKRPASCSAWSPRGQLPVGG